MKLANLLLGGILFLSFVVRFVNIDINPPAVYGDEISFAVNAWSILKTGVDEYGVRYPLQFRAFDDYKAPIPVYILLPFFYFLGMNAFSVRLPMVIVGTISVGVIYILTKKIFCNQFIQKPSIQIFKSREKLALIAALLFAISPWHVHLSRGYFEATLALLPFLLGAYWYLKGLNSKIYLYLSSIAFGTTLYTYFTPRILLFIFIPFLLIYFRKFSRVPRRAHIISGIIFLIIALPLVKLTIFNQGGNRMQYFIRERLNNARLDATSAQITAGGNNWLIKLRHNYLFSYSRQIMNDYLEHFSVNFWYLYGDNSLRYFLGKMGMFNLIEMPLFLIGIYSLIRNQKPIAGFLAGWLLLTPIPAALVGRSFAVRSLAMVPVPIIISGYGLVILLENIQKLKPAVLNKIKLIIGLSIGLSFMFYFLRYHLDYPKYAATWWGWENKKALEYAKERESEYDQIFLSDFYTGMPLALGFYFQSDPAIWRSARDNRVILEVDKEFMKVGKYYIGSLDLSSTRRAEDVLPPRTLYIGRLEEPDGIATILAPDDGRILFKVHIRQ